MKRKLALVFLAGLFGNESALADTFVVNNIDIIGLERIDPGAVYSALGIDQGDIFDTDNTSEVINSLYQLGFFSNIQIRRVDNNLVIEVVERPSIGSITVSGNRDIKTDDLMDALSSVGIAAGRTFDQSILSQVTQELEQQYFSRGKYGVIIDVSVTELVRNRVGIAIQISEGVAAKIREINIVGNQAYNNKTLIKQMSSSTPGWFTWLTKNDQYSRERLAGDLESIRSYYLDRGYLNFEITSTQVAISPNKKDIFITINVSEGELFTISDINFAGQLTLPESELYELTDIEPGDLFSRREVTDASTVIAERLGHFGYAFARVNAVPDIDDENNEIALTFFIDPGRRVYVRRINIHGNHITDAEVIRRELRQFEGAWLDTEKVQRSRTNLELLGFFENNIEIDTVPVPGTADQVDVDITVDERLSGQLTGGIGYSQVDGFLFNAGIRQNNFLGSGKLVDFVFNRSRSFSAYRIGYENPYYTPDGVSRGFSLYFQETDLDRANITNFRRDAYGGTLSYGIPVTEVDSIRVEFNPERLDIKTSDNNDTTSDEVNDFLDQQGNQFNVFKVRTAWWHTTINRILFPTEGLVERLGAEIAVPGLDLNFYRLTSTTWWYYPLTEKYVLALNADVGYGQAYGNTPEFPFFENFYAGGIGSVRGFRGNTLGPRDSIGDPLGGRILATGSVEFIFPMPFIQSEAIRSSLFIDGGNVYNSFGDIGNQARYSVGMTVQWLSPLGPLTFSLAKALNNENGDEIQPFQFDFGTPF